MTFESMNGKYYRTSMDDIKSSEGWFKKMLLLGLIYLIPIFGQIVVSGYAYEWAHKAAWGVKTPMPKKIFGRPNSKMFRWGWFALVISFVMMLIPNVVSSIGGFIGGLTGGANAASMYNYGSYYSSIQSTALASSGITGIFSLIAFVLMLAAVFFIWVGTMRMTMYDRLGPGFQFNKVWKMMTHDFGGLMRVFAMSILFSFIGAIIFVVVFAIVVMVFGFGAFLTAGSSYQNGSMDESQIALLVLALIGSLLPLILIISYVYSVYTVFVEMLTTRAVGYWTRQFDVANWGKDTDQLPFERVATYSAAPTAPVAQPQPTAQPQQPVAQAQPAAAQPQQPAAPVTDEPVVTAAEPIAPAAEPAPIEVEPVVEDAVTETPAVETPAAEATATTEGETPATVEPEASKEGDDK